MEQAHFSALETKHDGLETRIVEESRRPSPDSGLLAQLKKQKLKIKEEMEDL